MAIVDTQLEEVRRTIADRPGVLFDVAPELALQFVRDCSGDFEAVHLFRLPWA
jgi:hypothetical protein